MKKTLKGFVLASLVSSQFLNSPLVTLAETTKTSTDTTETDTKRFLPVSPKSTETSLNQQLENAPVSSDEQPENISENAPEVAPEIEKAKATLIKKIQQGKTKLFEIDTTANIEGNRNIDARKILEEAIQKATIVSKNGEATISNIQTAMTLLDKAIKQNFTITDTSPLATKIDEVHQLLLAEHKGYPNYTVPSIVNLMNAENVAVDIMKSNPTIVEVNKALVDLNASLYALVPLDALYDALAEVGSLNIIVPNTPEAIERKGALSIAIENAMNAIEVATTNEEIATLVQEIYQTLYDLEVAVVLNFVDEQGNPIPSDAKINIPGFITGTYRTSYTIPVYTIPGYEFLENAVSSSTGLAATDRSETSSTLPKETINTRFYGDGVNSITLTYKKLALSSPSETPFVIATSDNKLPATTENSATETDTQRNTNDNQTILPQTNETCNPLLPVIGSTILLFFSLSISFISHNKRKVTILYITKN